MYKEQKLEFNVKTIIMSEDIPLNAKKQIICIGTSPWDALPHRTQQLMTHLCSVEIIYFSPPHVSADIVVPNKKNVRSNIRVYLLPKDIQKVSNSPMFFTLRQKRLAQFITRTMAKHHIRNPILWLTHPSQEEMTCYLNYSTLVYDYFEPCHEDFFYAQECLLRKADLIFTASPSLKALAKEYNRNVALLENGVDYGIFESAGLFSRLDPLEKRVGFAGVIEYDLDLTPLLYMAKRRPQWKFLLLGPCPRGNPLLESLQKMDNIVFYGEHPVHVVPEFLLSCHVLMEFRFRNPVVFDINSNRLYEYFATGRPIVTHLWKDEVERFPDVVYISKTLEEYLKNCQIALKENPNLVSHRRKRYAKNGTWAKRAELILQVLTISRLMYE